MATDTAVKSVHNTLSGTTADTVTITGYERVAIINRTGTSPLYVAYEGDASPTTAVAAANDTDVVMPGGFIEVDTGQGGISIVGDGNAYSVVGVSA